MFSLRTSLKRCLFGGVEGALARDRLDILSVLSAFLIELLSLARRAGLLPVRRELET